MRQLTEAEELAMRQSRLLHIKSSGTRQVDISQVEAAKFGFRFGFIAGLDHAQARIEVLEAKLLAWEQYNDGLITRRDLAFRLMAEVLK